MTYQFQQIRPQKARGVLKESMWTDPNWVAEEKYDGDRRIIQFVNGYGRCTGSTESVHGGFVEKTENVPHLWAASPGTMHGTVLDGEILPPLGTKIEGGGSKYVTAIMGSKPEEAIRKQKERGWLRYVVFDCLYFKGKDIRAQALEKRQSSMFDALAAWKNPHATNVIGLMLDKKGYFDSIVKNGGEGVILKHLSHTYGNEKLWVKVKGEWTADVVVMGAKPGKGKNAGKVGSIIFGQYKDGQLVVMGAARGFDDALMEDLTLNFYKFKQRVMRIKHNGREPTGAFRHPRFDCWRLDKNAKDCVYDPEET